MRALEPHEPGSISSWLLAITVHVVLLAVLFFGIRWKTKQADPVMAELWTQLPPIEQPRVEPPPPPPVEAKPPPKPEPAPEARVEPKPAPKPDIALEQEKKKKEEAEKKQREEELRAKEAKEEKERRDKELAEKRRTEEENRKRMQDQLNRELAAASPKAPATAPAIPGDPAALATWQNQIVAKIRSNIILPPDLAGNPQAEFDVVLLPTGEVLSVRLARSSGNRALDDAWERAILKASPLPRPSRPEVFVRDLRLKFRPSE